MVGKDLTSFFRRDTATVIPFAPDKIAEAQRNDCGVVVRAMANCKNGQPGVICHYTGPTPTAARDKAVAIAAYYHGGWVEELYVGLMYGPDLGLWGFRDHLTNRSRAECLRAIVPRKASNRPGEPGRTDSGAGGSTLDIGLRVVKP